MSLHFKCPHNNAVYCNQGYELGEFYRQLNLAKIPGKYMPVHNDDNRKCQVPDAQSCPMCRNAMLHMTQQQRINTGK